MELVFGPTGPPELKREDGWFYRLHGIVLMEVAGFGLGYRDLLVTIANVSDQTLDSIRVLRDNFPDYNLRINHGN